MIDSFGRMRARAVGDALFDGRVVALLLSA